MTSNDARETGQRIKLYAASRVAGVEDDVLLRFTAVRFVPRVRGVCGRHNEVDC